MGIIFGLDNHFHRLEFGGSSNGEIPKETAAAYMRAIENGADFIETDILSLKDGVLICFHDVTLDDTTDVVEHKEFA
ncbi:glycerophosphoryl diester phosphodiesterase 2 [Pyrus ussuriensis x Pyrus communis]|uniref:glycerophosphodiester phosphodiesterase n=1 Tax=Pyrus ussuriensis x Pyrus communis TaxID=2448454 RepID=A0A5N5HYC4_9ROSA|nr:glycerophosphoryl diester phosphodiesterase 2 [Pyrus ussuriensis x Pyrus communis]